MGLPTFIRLENTLSQAHKYYNGPQMNVYSFAGVHLLPNNPFDYIQRTYAANGMEIEDYTVRVKDMCGNTLQDITDYFTVVNNFQDPDTGLPQLHWSINKYIPYDFGYRLIYLEIQSGANKFDYTSPFMLTAERGEYTSMWFYKNDNNGTMLSTGLQLYFKQPASTQELSNYSPVATGVTYTATSRLTKYEQWHSDIIDIYLIEKFKEIFLCRYIYALPKTFDGLPVKTGMQEAMDSPSLEGRENFAEFEAVFARKYSDTYNPDEQPYVPPGPVPGAPAITLTQVTRINSTQVRLYFTYENFTPLSLTAQYSLDGINWTSSTGSIVSPRLLNTPNNFFNNYYYRMVHLETGTASNVLQIPTAAIGIDSVVNIGPREYSIGYTLTGLTIPEGRYLEFQSSNNGTEWTKVITTYDNNNPKKIEVAAATPDMDRVRIKFDSIISNVVLLP